MLSYRKNMPVRDKLELLLFITTTAMICITRLSMAVGHVFTAIAVLIGLIMLVKYRSTISITPTFKRYVTAFGFFLLAAVPAALFTGNIKLGLRTLLYIDLYRFLFFLFIPLLITKKKYIVWMLCAFFVSVSLDSITAIFQFLSLPTSDRGEGFAGPILGLAGLLSIALPAMVVFMTNPHTPQLLRKVVRPAFIFSFAGLLANQSRGAWLTAIITLPISMFSEFRIKFRHIVVAILLIVGCAGVFLYSDSFTHRMESITNTTTDGSNLGRIYVWKSSVNMYKDSPIIGVGLGQFSKIYEAKYRFPEETQHLNQSHNNILHVAAESGTIGLLGLFIFGASTLIFSFSEWWKTRNPYDLLMFLTVLSYIFLFGQIEYTLINSSGMRIFWVLLGAYAALKEFDRKATQL